MLTHAIQFRTAWKTCMSEAVDQAVCCRDGTLALNLLVQFLDLEWNERVLEPIEFAFWDSVTFT